MTDLQAAELRRGLTIGALDLDRRLMMAPMAGITSPAFRRSVRRWDAGLVFTEMISSQGIDHGNRHTLDYLRCGAGEHPIGFQLFGADPLVLARAAEVCLRAGADLIDINMACPVRKVVKTGAGAALLAEPELAEAAVAAVVGAVGEAVPVTVKLRAGVRMGDEAGLRVAPGLVAAGAAAVFLHPRYAAQLFRGAADHTITLRLAAELPVPVVASGDIGSRELCLELLAAGVSGVTVARAALGRPWIFRELLDGLPEPPVDERLKELRLFVEEVVAEEGSRAVGHLRRFWPHFRRSGTIDRERARGLMAAPDTGAVRQILGGA
jgi:tRNA-dihydrouridine synthase B